MYLHVGLRAQKRFIAINELPTGKLSAQKSQVVSLMTPSSFPSSFLIIKIRTQTSNQESTRFESGIINVTVFIKLAR